MGRVGTVTVGATHKTQSDGTSALTSWVITKLRRHKDVLPARKPEGGVVSSVSTKKSYRPLPSFKLSLTSSGAGVRRPHPQTRKGANAGDLE